MCDCIWRVQLSRVLHELQSSKTRDERLGYARCAALPHARGAEANQGSLSRQRQHVFFFKLIEELLMSHAMPQVQGVVL